MCVLKELGFSSQESLLTVQSNGKLLVPLQNYRGEQISLGEGLELGEVECIDSAVKPEAEPISDPVTLLPATLRFCVHT